MIINWINDQEEGDDFINCRNFLPIFTNFYRFSQQKCQKGKNYYMVKYYGTPKGTYVRGIGKGMKKFIPMRNTTMGASNPYF